MKLKRARRITGVPPVPMTWHSAAATCASLRATRTGETPVIRQSSPKTRRILAFDDSVDPAPTCSRGLLPAAMILLHSPAFNATVDAIWLSPVAPTHMLLQDRVGEFHRCVVK